MFECLCFLFSMFKSNKKLTGISSDNGYIGYTHDIMQIWRRDFISRWPFSFSEMREGIENISLKQDVNRLRKWIFSWDFVLTPIETNVKVFKRSLIKDIIHVSFFSFCCKFLSKFCGNPFLFFKKEKKLQHLSWSAQKQLLSISQQTSFV